MHRIPLPLLAVMSLLAVADVGAQTEARTSDQPETTADDIERLVETLEDPQARARLIGDLELLLEAQRTADAAGSGPEVPDITDTLGWLKNLFADLWARVTSVDPMRLTVAAAMSIGILIAAFLVRWLLLMLLRRLYTRLTSGTASEEQAGEHREAAGEGAGHDRIELPRTLSRLIDLLIGLLALILIATAWGAGFERILNSALGSGVAQGALSIGLILVVTVVLWHAAERLIERLLRLGTRRQDRVRTTRRLDTLVPLLSSVLKATIGVFAGLLIASELGVNIGPLLAGAGILGLAVGFGAQTLVKDLITGVTILLEDGATVGDIVDVAGHSGVVEEMRMRVLQLRDLSGIVHLVPYSDITTIMNFTKDFSYYLFEIGIAYREDTDTVCGVLMELSEELGNDEVYGGKVLEPLQILGVDKFADSAVIIKARIKTLPGEQWAVGREFNRRMKKRFDEENIEIPFPHTTVYFGEPKEGKAPPMQLALAGDDGRLRAPPVRSAREESA